MAMMTLSEIREKTGYEKRTYLGEPEGACLLCGRKTLGGDETPMVGMDTDGTLTLEPDASQGFFYVGPNCYRKYIHASDIDTDYWIGQAGGEPTYDNCKW